ncbi:archaetidylserine decarboxylase [Paraferrimonas sedimenticola]|uniref:Phosphatidylserine decarboxylase proenzyme n=1 Tax=Paraferrimonas sedimenticola TaxID=375674 RepID=A0AA37RU13_9GAMM|nr:archaetidylserine decarboxylase [Paraferrimonas sedimenticola]GLP95750.1 phosphatidylserine decarboxylase proenzyme [Paraferrimonas sedimenticola]
MDKFFIFLQYVMPKHALSRLVGWLAAKPRGIVTRTFINWFADKYRVNMDEAAEPDTSKYASFNDFFTRALKDGARPIVADDKVLAHPVDGAVSQCGPIESGRIFQAKGHDFTAQELLGGDSRDSDVYNNGQFATIYLSPRDYHRIHMPIKGTLRKMTYVPGDLFSVNPLTAQNVPRLFARNERVVAIFDTEIGPMAMVLVGATIVASIETVWAGTVTPPAGKQVFSWDYDQLAEPIVLDKGEEMGRFKLGSTVVLLFGENAIESFAEGVEPQAPTVMGTPFAHIANGDVEQNVEQDAEQTEQ